MDQEEDDAHDLIPDSIAKDIPRLYATEKQEDPTVYLKLFTPDSSWTWMITEYDPEEKIAFGLADGFEREMGYVSIEELENITGPWGLKIERDLHWKPKPLSEAIQELNNRGHQDRLDQDQDPGNDLHR